MKNRLGTVLAFGLVMVLGIILLTACAAPAEPAVPPPAAPSSVAPSPTVPIPAAPSPVVPSPATPPVVAPSPAATFPIEITDQLGRVVKLKKAPQRIISLSPSNTEILFSLGLGDRIVGVDQYSDYPSEAKTKAIIGGFSTTNVEKVVALNPDLIVAGSIHQPKVIPVLESLGFTVVGLDPKTIEEVLGAITLVGKITGEQATANQVVAGLSSRIKAVTDKTSNLSESRKPRVFYLVWTTPLMSSGNGSFQADLIQKAGGINIAQAINGFATISIEAVIAANPEVMITDDQSMSGGGANAQFINTDPRLANTAARKNNQVFTVTSGFISHSGPRLVDALEQFAKLIHPELFK